MERCAGEVVRWQQAVSVTYVGQAGRDQLRKSALEQPNPNFSGIFYLTQNDALSNYNALQVQYRRPLSGRVQALLNYTYSHSLDNVSDDDVAGPSDTVISYNRATMRHPTSTFVRAFPVRSHGSFPPPSEPLCCLR